MHVTPTASNANEILRASLLATRERPAVQPGAAQEMHASAREITPTAPPTVPITTDAPLTVDGLQSAWGTDHPVYDLDADGTVGMSDLIMLLAKLQQPASEPVNDRSPSAEPTATAIVPEPGDDGTEKTENQLTVDGLSAAWGETDSPYDLSGDGVVDMKDLVQLLSQLGGEATSGPGPLTLEGLREAWGQSDSPYDFDQSGTVNMSDLLQMLSRVSHNQDVGDGDAAITGGPSDPLTVDGLLGAWGGPDAMYDLDASGVVDMGDLLSLLSHLDQRNPRLNADRAAIAGLVPTIAPPAANETDAARNERVRPAATSLLSRFQANGFTMNPPQNVHSLLEQLNMSSSDRKTLLSQLNGAYPNGLGLNVLG